MGLLMDTAYRTDAALRAGLTARESILRERQHQGKGGKAIDPLLVLSNDAASA